LIACRFGFRFNAYFITYGLVETVFRTAFYGGMEHAMPGAAAEEPSWER